MVRSSSEISRAPSMLLAKRSASFGILRRQLLLDSGKLQLQGGERLPGAIVQVARNAAALVILHAQQTGRELPQVLVALLELTGSFAHAEFQLRA